MSYFLLLIFSEAFRDYLMLSFFTEARRSVLLKFSSLKKFLDFPSRLRAWFLTVFESREEKRSSAAWNKHGTNCPSDRHGFRAPRIASSPFEKKGIERAFPLRLFCLTICCLLHPSVFFSPPVPISRTFQSLTILDFLLDSQRKLLTWQELEENDFLFLKS